MYAKKIAALPRRNWPINVVAFHSDAMQSECSSLLAIKLSNGCIGSSYQTFSYC